MKYLLVCAPILFATLLLATPAHADVAPPETTPCLGKTVGATCDLYGTAGTCQDQTCTKLDYAHWDRDASSSPPLGSYACLKCIAGSNTNTTTGTSSTTDTGSETSTGSETGTGSETSTDSTTSTGSETSTGSTTSSGSTTSTALTTNTVTNTDNGAPPSEDDGACSIGKQVTAKRVAPWLLAGAFSLLFLFGRRRRQS